MTRDTSLSELVSIADSFYQSERAKLSALIAQEVSLRTALRKLDEQNKQSIALTAAERQPLQQIGGDIIWQRWISKNRTDLNRQLALCLAQKARLLTRLRKAHGKAQATTSLLKAEMARSQAKKDQKELQDQLSLNLLREGHP